MPVTSETGPAALSPPPKRAAIAEQDAGGGIARESGPGAGPHRDGVPIRIGISEEARRNHGQAVAEINPVVQSLVARASHGFLPGPAPNTQ